MWNALRATFIVMVRRLGHGPKALTQLDLSIPYRMRRHQGGRRFGDHNLILIEGIAISPQAVDP
jgi:hypothetical protein